MFVPRLFCMCSLCFRSLLAQAMLAQALPIPTCAGGVTHDSVCRSDARIGQACQAGG